MSGRPEPGFELKKILRKTERVSYVSGKENQKDKGRWCRGYKRQRETGRLISLLHLSSQQRRAVFYMDSVTKPLVSLLTIPPNGSKPAVLSLVSGPAISASPGYLLEMQILRLNLGLLNQKLGLGPSNLQCNKPSR